MIRPALLVLLALVAFAASVTGERVIFTAHSITGDATGGVLTVSANLTAWADAPSEIHAATGSRLWTTTLFASDNVDGSGNTNVFNEVTLDQQQAQQPFVPGGTLMFEIPTTIDVQELSNYGYLCLRIEKDPDAEPDFEFTAGSDDYVTPCMHIFSISAPIEDSYPCAFSGSFLLHGGFKQLDPCSLCTCRNGTTTCNFESCLDFAGCLPEEQVAEECCLQCPVDRISDRSPCSFRGDLLQHGESMKLDPCTNCTCMHGTTTCNIDSCNMDGACPPDEIHTIPEECCPRCLIEPIRNRDPCSFGGDLLQHGESMILDPCKKCTCLHGTTTCYTESCKPVVGCPPDEIVKTPEECCPKCPNVPIDDRKPCTFLGRFLQHGDSMQTDSCTSCTCKNGTTKCNIESCPVVGGCLPEERVNIPEECCAQCPYVPEQVLLDTHDQAFTFTRTSPDIASFNYEVTNRFLLNEASAGFAGGQRVWRLRMFISENADGSGRQIQISPQVLNPAEASHSIYSGETMEFTTRGSFNFPGVTVGPGGDYPYICADFDSMDDSLEVLFQGSKKSTKCGEVPAYPSDDRKPCSFLGRFLQHGDSMQTDSCTSCTCKNGTTECNIKSCPVVVGCLPEERVNIPEECCAQCPYVEVSRPLPDLLPVPEQVLVDTHDLGMTFTRTSPDIASFNYEASNRFSLNQASAGVAGGQPVWQVRMFVSENADGSGRQEEISPQVLNQDEASRPVNPGEIIEFTSGGSFDFTGLTIGPGGDYPYICAAFDSMDDNVEVSYQGREKATTCQELPTMGASRPSPDLIQIARETRSCSIWGDPHTRTFDGYGYTHQGDDGFFAVKTCRNEDGGVPDFEIVAENSRTRPSKPITYIRDLRLYYNGGVYALTHPNDASVDGVKVTLPYADVENGVRMHFAPPHKILTTDFGLIIRSDDNHNSDITLSVSYMNKVCGLCGNFDGDRSNECQNLDGTSMNRPNEECKIEHTVQWRYIPPGGPPPPLYPEDFKPVLPPCDEGSPNLDTARLQCGVLMDTLGPLAECHAYVDPDIYFMTCTYDLCMLHPETFFLCSSVETYIQECSRASNYESDIGDWRAVATQCEPSCSDDMVFNPRGNACPRSCANPEGSADGCPVPSIGVCECPDGKLLDGNKCVPEEECGCKMPSGRYLSIGEAFMNNDCNEQCSCVSNDALQCAEIRCTEHATCGTKSGARDCYCDDGYLGDGQTQCNTTGKVCHIYGDPHFHTFDGDWYSFQGDCAYTAVKTCKPLAAGIPKFRIMIESDTLIPEERFTYLTSIRLHFEDHIYKFKYTGVVSVDGTDVAASLPYENENVGIYRDGSDVVMETTFGVRISYDGENDARIEIPEAYFDKVCGLCGNADGDDTNDKQKPDGTLAKKLVFANSWGPESCPEVEKAVATCEPGTKDYEDAVDICTELVRADGPFAHCHGFKSPFSFYNSCIYDLCGTLPATDMFCSSARVYLRACAEKGGIFRRDWESTVKYCGTPDCLESYSDYKQSCYKFVPGSNPYQSAKSACESEGAHLATISSGGENDFVASLAENQRAWIGATRNRSATFSTYTSNATGPYTFLPNRLTRGIGSFRFAVQGHSGAHLLLSTTQEVDEETPVYEIVLGADKNKRNFLRRCMTCQPKDQNTKSHLNKRRSRDFFVNFKGGNIQVGDMKTKELILQFSDPLPLRVRYIAFKTVGRTGTWKFYETEFMWNIGQQWTFDNFRFGEPNLFQRQEYCLETNYVRPGVWNDHFCSGAKPFICEIDGY